jgi:putative ABC transport system permease protein
MASLAIRNLFHDRVRLIVTLTGIVFAVVLISIQVGLYIGFRSTISSVIDNSNADIWITSRYVRYIEVGVAFPERKIYDVLATPGVAEAQKVIVQFSDWTRPDGAQEGTELIGFNPDSTLLAPWNLVEGSVKDLKRADAVIIDRFYAEKLGVDHLNQVCEIRGHRARIVGFTSGIRTFTTAATVFTSFKNAQTYQPFPIDQTLFILVKARPGTDLRQLKHSLQTRLKGVDVLTTQEFSSRTVYYWMFSTGAGITVIIAAVLGLIVGIVVVAQTIYAATIDHIREFGTLKAMGASNGYIYRIILEQAAISAVLGYVIGIAIAFMAIRAEAASAPILLPNAVAAGMFVLTLFMCCVAALVSINKVTRIDPAMVFKG